MQHSPLIAAKTKEIIAAYQRILEASLRDAQAQGALARGDAMARAELLFAYMEGALGQARIHDDLDMIKQLKQAGPKLLLAEAGTRSTSAHH